MIDIPTDINLVFSLGAHFTIQQQIRSVNQDCIAQVRVRSWSSGSKATVDSRSLGLKDRLGQICRKEKS